MTDERKGRDGRADFDFFMGSWTVRHRRLRERLMGSDSWEEFEGTSVARRLLGGLGNIDENVMEREAGRLEGVSLRLYDPLSRQWSIYWADSVNGTLEAPVVGGFGGGRGEFYAQEVLAGRRVFSRFIWSDITADSCRWEQALSDDGGRTWETNWVMEFTRRGRAGS